MSPMQKSVRLGGSMNRLSKSPTGLPQDALKHSVVPSHERVEARTVEAAMFPGTLPAFPGVDTPEMLEMAVDDNLDWVLANFAHLAYRKEHLIEARAQSLGATAVRVRCKEQAVGFFAVFPWFAVLSFRGTVSTEKAEVPVPVQNAATSVLRPLQPVLGEANVPQCYRKLISSSVMADLNFAKTTLHGVKVHRGFLKELRLIWDLLEADIEELYDGSVPIYVTGHSLGGAMATLATAHREFDKLVTFGEPRVGARLNRLLKVSPFNHIRWVNGFDPVPELPPTVLKFQHHGVLRRLLHRFGPNLLVDHSIASYVDNLGDALNVDVVKAASACSASEEGGGSCSFDEAAAKQTQEREVRRAMLQRLFFELPGLEQVKWSDEVVVGRFHAKLLRSYNPNEWGGDSEDQFGVVYLTPSFLFFTNASLSLTSVSKLAGIVLSSGMKGEGSPLEEASFTRISPRKIDMAIPIADIKEVTRLFRFNTVTKSCFSLKVHSAGQSERTVALDVMWKHAEKSWMSFSTISNSVQPHNIRVAVEYLRVHPPRNVVVRERLPFDGDIDLIDGLSSAQTRLVCAAVTIQEQLSVTKELMDTYALDFSANKERTLSNLSMAEELDNLVQALLVGRVGVCQSELQKWRKWRFRYAPRTHLEERALQVMSEGSQRVNVILFNTKLKLAVLSFGTDSITLLLKGKKKGDEERVFAEIPFDSIRTVLLHWRECLLVVKYARKQEVSFFVSATIQVASELCHRTGRPEILRADPSKSVFDTSLHEVCFVPLVATCIDGRGLSCTLAANPMCPCGGEDSVAQDDADEFEAVGREVEWLARSLAADHSLLLAQLFLQRRIINVNVVHAWRPAGNKQHCHRSR